MRFHSLRFSNFRNYAAAEVFFKFPLVVLYGPNGAGKTNFLEAISFLAPGKGLRGASGGSLNLKKNEGWAVTASLSREGEPYTLSTGKNSETPHRVFYVDGELLNSNAQANLFFTCIWTTPHMERLFSAGFSSRRKFLDSLILSEYAEYSKELLALERMVSSRNKILAENPDEILWLNGVEDSIARHSVAIAAIRRNFIERINHYLSAFPEMPSVQAGLECPIDEKLKACSALEAEDFVREKLHYSRNSDRESKRTSWGAHKTDFIVSYKQEAKRAEYCSSGEQKMILLTLVLAQAENLKNQLGRIPALLLDEPLVHLDSENAHLFLENLERLKVPSFLTGTEKESFASLKGKADFFMVHSGQISLE